MQFMPAVGGYQLIATAISPIRSTSASRRMNSPRGSRAFAKCSSRPSSSRDVALKMDISPENGATFLQELAFAGFRLFQSIFAGPEASSELKDVGMAA